MENKIQPNTRKNYSQVYRRTDKEKLNKNKEENSVNFNRNYRSKNKENDILSINQNLIKKREEISEKNYNKYRFNTEENRFKNHNNLYNIKTYENTIGKYVNKLNNKVPKLKTEERFNKSEKINNLNKYSYQTSELKNKNKKGL